MILTLARLAWAEPCATPTPVDDLRLTVARAERAFEGLDEPGFRGAVDEARAALPCLAAPIPVDVAADLHRMVGLERYLAQDALASTAAGAASRALDPEFHFADTFLPPGHPYRLSVEGFDPSGASFRDLPPPRSGAVWLDGAPAARRPNAWASIVQVLDDTGDVVTTTYVWPEDALPVYPGHDPHDDLPSPVPPTELGPAVRPLHPARLPLAIGAAALGVGSVVAYGIAGGKASTFARPGVDLTREEIYGLQEATNAWVVVSGALGGSAVVSASLAVAF